MNKTLAIQPVDALSAAWCDADVVVTSVMEAMSFVTPALERFLVQAVARQLPEQPELRERCRDFIREESRHRRMHALLNSSLLDYLCVPPLGLAHAESILAWARTSLSAASQLRLVAASEHLTAVLSKQYLARSVRWTFTSRSAKAVFDSHAHDELRHRSVAFDLCADAGSAGRVSRGLALASVVLGAALYLVIASPSILRRKTGQGFVRCLGRVIRRAAGNLPEARGLASELIHFAREGYHPRSLVQGTESA